ncbi:hypothetical protein PsYK624_147270 [Phanerochaete sordida]|uniref:G-patch domain-containing protein n=1 Tax=Phanerochaete sordida TaxID=48140 RepID=A0A9P3GN54_9APHY|nr:hypothetical protein PsYK624_147270 [Phanerochaete sordida]
MATVTHVIRSHYDSKDRDALELATGQVPSSQHEGIEEDVDADLAWQTESAFGAQRRLANAPKFVKAIVSYDEINNMIGLPKHFFAPPKEEPKTEVAGWYKSLTRQASPAAGPGTIAAPSRASTSPLDATASSSSTSIKPSAPSTAAPTPHRRPDKNNWFITRALQSEPTSAPATPPPTLADILARAPPPPADKAVKPPVFLALGPANKGWGMLEQQGWAEGEGLGATAPRQVGPRSSLARAAAKRKGKQAERRVIKQEEREVQLDADGDISIVSKVEVVDLTLSDSDDDVTEDAEPEDEEPLYEPPPISSGADADPHSKPLLTPIPTILKSDRLGIGLKAKTVGPYKESKKRITHNQAALARHVRETEEMRRLKALVGRGSRGLARLAKADSEHRRHLLASLNSP